MELGTGHAKHDVGQFEEDEEQNDENQCKVE
jgi:hypothetical protein